MIVEFSILGFYCSEKLTVYTCYLGDNDLSEFEYFYEQSKEFRDGHLKEMYIIKATLEKMKNKGAKEFYFKEERNANALPRLRTTQIQELNNSDYGVRLYCIRLRDDTLVLLNGGIKTNQNPEDCPNVSQHFKIAIQIATKIDKAILSKEIDVNQHEFLKDLTFVL